MRTIYHQPVSLIHMATRSLSHEPRFRQTPSTRAYPWGDWLDGSTWELTREDYDGTLASFRSRCYYMAREFGYRLRTRVLGDLLYIQALDSEGNLLPPLPPGT